MFAAMISHIDVIWEILVVLLLASITLYVTLRAGSAHLLHLILWRLIFGRARCQDADIDRWIADRNAWIQFRLLSGIRTRSLAASKRLIHWARQHGEEEADIARCGSYFHTEQLRLKVPGRWEEIVFLLVTSFFLASAGMAVAASFAPSSWVSVAAPHAHGLRLSGTSVVVSDTRKALDASLCRTTPLPVLATRTELRQDEVTVICGWFADPAFAQKADAALASQREALMMAALVALGYGWSALRGFCAARAARAMGQRLAMRRQRLRRARRARRRDRHHANGAPSSPS